VFFGLLLILLVLWYFIIVKNYLLVRVTQHLKIGIAFILVIFNLLLRGISLRFKPWGILLGSELAIFTLWAAWIWVGSSFFTKKKDRPLAVVFIVTVLNALILILFVVWPGWNFQSMVKDETGLVTRLASGFLLIVLAAILGLIFRFA
jgi:hypothetical protein